MGRVLIVDDDAISLRFLEAALRQLGCETLGAGNMIDALAVAASTRFDLLLLDRCMPGGGGIELLAALRMRGISTPAFATSAEIDADVAAQLRAAGFAGHIGKPVTLARLADVLQAHVSPPTVLDVDESDPRTAWLDDAAALAAIGGDRHALAALRVMLVEELTALLDALAMSEATALLERLHRLRASCGFCGAPRLARAASLLERALRALDGDPASARGEFAACCRSTLAALRTAVSE